MLIFVLAQTLAAGGLTVERLDDSAFLVGLPAASGQSAARIQQQIEPAAAQSCRTRRPVLGRFRFLAETGKARFEQEVLCLDRGQRLTVMQAAATGAALAPSRADQHAVLAASYAYFSAKDSGRYAQAHQLLSPRLRDRSPLAQWTAAARDFDAEAGAVRARRVTEITWYKDPEGAPEPGLYAAADFSAEFAAAEFVCGYLMWHVQPDGSFRLAREEQNIAPKRSSGRPIAQIDRDPLRARMGCKD